MGEPGSSLYTDISGHAGAMMMNVGALQPNRPSLGAWLVYGLGTESQNLPGFVAMSPRAQPRCTLANWGNAFLPGAYAGSDVNIASMKPDAVMRDLRNPRLSTAAQREQVELLARLNQTHLARLEHDQDLEAVIAAMEMAFRMQFCVPAVFDIQKETAATRALYGDSEYGRGCLIARRLIEQGVRVVQLSLSIDDYDIAWDTGHENIVDGHARLARACDQGIAALILDLKARGLFSASKPNSRTAYELLKNCGPVGCGRVHAHHQCHGCAHPASQVPLDDGSLQWPRKQLSGHP